jgi:Transposase
MSATHHSTPPSVPPTSAAAAAPYVGIDLAKEKLHLAGSDDPDAAVQTFANDPAGIALIVRSLAAVKPSMVVVESTGGLERPLLNALLQAALPVALVHPGRVRHFAKALGIQAKTDRIDARVLARFGRQAAPRLPARGARPTRPSCATCSPAAASSVPPASSSRTAAAPPSARPRSSRSTRCSRPWTNRSTASTSRSAT